LPGHLTQPWSERRDEQTWTLRIGAASGRLRAARGLPDGAEIADTFQRTLAAANGRVVVEVAVGFPEETAADRAAVFQLAGQLDVLAPPGARRVTVRVQPYVDADHPHPSPAWLEHAEALAACGVQAAPAIGRGLAVHGDAWLEGRLAAQPELTAAALLALVEAGSADGRGACPPASSESPHWRQVLDVWRRALRAKPVPDDPPAPASPGAASPQQAAALTGLEDACSRVRGRAPGAGPAASGIPAVVGPRGDRPWERWNSVVPRHFDYRLEYEKRGRLRHLGHRELAEAILRACQRARLPVATTGVAKPRPRLTFGPPLPVGIEGLQEFVDLGLALKIPHLRPTLNEWLPDGLLVNRASFIPPGSCRNALAQPAAAQYEAALPSDCWRHPGDGLTLLARRIEALRAAACWPVEGREGLDAKAQVTDLTVRCGDAGVATLAFTLDLTPPTAKVSPGELLEMLLGGLVHEVRLLRVRRTRLLVRWPEDSAAWCTPSEQVMRVQRELREKAKHCA
jgi:radical SAM-linked protein